MTLEIYYPAPELAVEQCSPNPIVNQDVYAQSYTYKVGEPALIIPLDDVISNGDCKYFVSLIEATSRQAAPSEVFKLESPSFVTASTSELTTSVTVKE